MRIALRYTIWILAGLLVILSVDGYLAYREQVRLFDQDRRKSVLRLGHAVATVVRDVLRRRGPEAARAVLEDADRSADGVRVRWVEMGPDADPTRRPLLEGTELSAVARGEDVTANAPGDAGSLRVTYVPLGGNAAVELSESLTPERRFVTATIQRTSLLAVVLLLFGAGGAVLLGIRFFGRPLAELMGKVHRIGEGDLGGPVVLRHRDELSRLADAINEMCAHLRQAGEKLRVETEARIAAVDQLRHADRLTTVGRLASGVAHELGTPLNVVAGRAAMIASGHAPDEAAHNAEIIRRQAERMTNIIRQLLGFARNQPRRAPTSLVEVAREAVELVHPLRKSIPVTLLVQDGADEPADVDREQMQQVVTNLVVNALQASTDAQEVLVRVGKRRARRAGSQEEERDWFFLEVEDGGGGIPPDRVKHLFDPFYTTKGVGEGTGLGLSIVHGIARDHGGWVEVASEEGQGSRFTVYLPEGKKTCVPAS